MKIIKLVIVAAGTSLISSCAATPPKELVRARQAYHYASQSHAAKVAPAETHVARQALLQAEQAFEKDPDSYKTTDLSYIAERKAQLAMATASIIIEQQNQGQSRDAYQMLQGQIITKTQQELSDTRGHLATKTASGERTSDQLYSERTARHQAEQQVETTQAQLADSQTRGAVTAERLNVEQQARREAEQETARAKEELAELAAIKEDKRGIIITLTGSVLFASNQSDLLPEARARLGKVAAVLLSLPERKLIIEGHTDSQGSASYNIDLSQRRADMVRSYLVEQGYLASRIKSHGLGQGRPIADNASAEGRANNRRVEIIVSAEGHASN